MPATLPAPRTRTAYTPGTTREGRCRPHLERRGPNSPYMALRGWRLCGLVQDALGGPGSLAVCRSLGGGGRGARCNTHWCVGPPAARRPSLAAVRALFSAVTQHQGLGHVRAGDDLIGVIKVAVHLRLPDPSSWLAGFLPWQRSSRFGFETTCGTLARSSTMSYACGFQCVLPQNGAPVCSTCVAVTMCHQKR